MKTKLLTLALACAALAACNKATAPAAGPAPTGACPGEDTVVATYKDQKVTLGELDKELGKQLYDVRRQGLEEMILKKLVNEEAKKAGQDEETFLKGIMEKAAADVPDADAQRIYEQNQQAFQGKSFDEVKGQIKARMGGREALMKYIEGLKTQANLKINLPEPRTQVAATGPAKGPENAPVTIVIFSDFQCPFCSKVEPTLNKVMADYAGKVRMVWRDFPLPFHDKAPKAAEAARCANEQGKFWEMHDKLFEHQDKLAPEDMKATAKELGLDGAKFDQCLDSGKFSKAVDADKQDGAKAGVSGTPAFFINGRVISGAQPFEEFKRIIDDELAKKG